jgi:threonine/homoserine/homoserine lactone efflux protein
MIEFKLFFALVSYYFVMFATPGPNNAMLTASGIKFGFKKTLPHLIGIPFGHVIQITLVCFGLGTLFKEYPLIQIYLKWICFFYLLFLGWKILGSFSNTNKES